MIKTIIECFVVACLFTGASSALASEHGGLSNGVTKSTDKKEKSDDSKKKDDPKKAESKTSSETEAKPASPSVKENRWFDLNKAEVSFRVRYIDGVPKAVQKHSTNLQHRELVDGRFKFDKDAKYTLNLHASSGYYFTRSFAETGVGLPWNQEQGWDFFLRHMYFSAKPIKGVEIQYGSMPFSTGVLEENTTWDLDGYVDGQRLTIKRPDKLFFDEATVTFGYVGDLFTPNVFRRLHRMGEVNYRQFLVTKNINSRFAMTAEYESKNGTVSTDKKTPANVQTIHSGVKIDARGSVIADRVWMDFYHRINPEPGWGFNLHAEKGFMKDRLVIGYGYTQIDKAWQNLYDVQDWAVTPKKSPTLGMAPGGSPSGEKWTRGKHPFFTINYKLTPELSFVAFANKDLDQSFAHGSSSQMSAGLAFDVLKTMKRFRWVK